MRREPIRSTSSQASVWPNADTAAATATSTETSASAATATATATGIDPAAETATAIATAAETTTTAYNFAIAASNASHTTGSFGLPIRWSISSASRNRSAASTCLPWS